MSLKEVAGGPSPAAIEETRTAAKAVEGVSHKYVVVDGSDQASNEYPYVPFAPDSYDETAEIKYTFGHEDAVGGNFTVPLDTEDIEYVKRQRDQAENADFDRWVMQKYNLINPAQMKVLQKIAPDEYQRRMDLVDYQQNIVTKYAKTRLEGPKSMEDLKFEWLVETGRIELPKAPLWDPIKWMGAQMMLPTVPATNRDWAQRALPNFQRFEAGFFSPLSYLTNKNAGLKKRENNPADIQGKNVLQGQIVNGASIPDAVIISKYGTNPIVGPQLMSYADDRVGEYFGYDPARAPRANARINRGPIRAGKGYGNKPTRPRL